MFSHFLPKVKDPLSSLTNLGFFVALSLESFLQYTRVCGNRLPFTHPSTFPLAIWEAVTRCHKMVIFAKKDGTPQRTIDFQSLNTHATRKAHHTQSPFHTKQGRSPRGVFDAWNGYHSVSPHPDYRHYTTFITPRWGYQYCTAPQGYIASGDGYTSRYDEIVSSISNKTKCVDDTLLTSVGNMESPSIQWNLDLPKMKSSLLALKSRIKQFDHVRNTLGLSLTLPPNKALQMSDPGLVWLTRYHSTSAWLKQCYHFGRPNNQFKIEWYPTTSFWEVKADYH